MSITITAPNQQQVVTHVLEKQVTLAQLQSIILNLAEIAHSSIMFAQQGHIRTGNTSASIEIWTVDSSGNRFAVAVGSRARGNVLHWLDRGRGEVLPKTRKMLRFIAYPSGQAVFTRRSRATQGLGFMAEAAAKVQTATDDAVHRALNVTYTT
jgi:hypothetical protein